MNLRKLCTAGALALGLGVTLLAERVPLPTTEGQSLSGHDVTLPTAALGHQAILVIGFSYASQKPMERWDKEIGAQVTARPGVPLYNIAVLQDAPRFIRGIIIRGIKAMVPEAGRNHFLTLVKGQEDLKKAVNFSNGEEAYVVVLDTSGHVIFSTHGDPTETAKRQVLEQLKVN